MCFSVFLLPQFEVPLFLFSFSEHIKLLLFLSVLFHIFLTSTNAISKQKYVFELFSVSLNVTSIMSLLLDWF